MNFKLIFNDRSARREQVCPQGAANLACPTVHMCRPAGRTISLSLSKAIVIFIEDIHHIWRPVNAIFKHLLP